MKPKLPPLRPKPAGKDALGRPKVELRGTTMKHWRATRLAALEPLISRANAKRMTIPAAAEWLGFSESSLRNWIRILKLTWRKGRERKVFKHDRKGWDEAIVAGLKEGRSMQKIGEQLGVGHWMVSRHVKTQGLWAVVTNQEPRVK